MEISYDIRPEICCIPMEDGITEFMIKSSYYIEERDDYIQAGSGSGYIFDNPFDDDQLIDLLDTVNGDTYALSNVLTGTQEGQELLEQALKIVYVHTYEIKPEFRGKGIGLYTMEFIIDLFSGNNLILLHPSPLDKNRDHKDFESSRKRLENHWAKAGFRKIENSGVFYVC